MKKEYPSWVCSECAIKGGGRMPDGHLATWHNAICPCCGDYKAVTEPRDWHHPKLTSKFKYEQKEKND